MQRCERTTEAMFLDKSLVLLVLWNGDPDPDDPDGLKMAGPSTSPSD